MADRRDETRRPDLEKTLVKLQTHVPNTIQCATRRSRESEFGSWDLVLGASKGGGR